MRAIKIYRKVAPFMSRDNPCFEQLSVKTFPVSVSALIRICEYLLIGERGPRPVLRNSNRHLRG